MSAEGNNRGQMLLAEEYFSTQDGEFLNTFRQVTDSQRLASFADRWKIDPRPWARQQIFRYLQLPFNCQGHQPVVKRLFKYAEERKDHELMAAFLVAFDLAVRRRIETRWRWDRASRSGVTEDVLVTPRNVMPLPPGVAAKWKNHRSLGMERIPYEPYMPGNPRLYTFKTRYYLRRRAWRYFRFMGYQQPKVYVTAVLQALERYTDEDLALGENVIDSWGLLHICHGGSDVLEFGKLHIRVKNGRALDELQPAPAFPELWKAPEVAPRLFRLLSSAPSRFVRTWAVELLQREHKNFSPGFEELLRLLEHEDAEMQQLGAQLLEGASWLGTLPVTDWLRLLKTRNDVALQRICELFVKLVTPNRFSLAETIDLACQQPVPVARAGQKFLREQKVETPTDRKALLAVANAQCPAVAGELTTWALGCLGTAANYDRDQIIRFFDALLEPIRESAWNWLIAGSPGLADPVLWSRLIETPFEDLRLRLIDFLQRQEKLSLPAAETGSLVAVWQSVLLGVHRGGRQKLKAVQQIAHAIQAEPAQAETLLPVLAVAVRSVRGPEARAGLAAVASVMDARPELAALVQKQLPELKLVEAGA